MFGVYDRNSDDNADGRILCRHLAPTSFLIFIVLSANL